MCSNNFLVSLLTVSFQCIRSFGTKDSGRGVRKHHQTIRLHRGLPFFDESPSLEVRVQAHQANQCLINGVLRFEKNDILRIVRALAIFRPSLIALQMPLTEEDEIFVEKCVQRSVIVSGIEHCGRAASDREGSLPTPTHRN